MKKFADLLILAAGILWGIATIVVTNMKSLGFEPIQISGLRWTFSAIFMALGLLIINPSKFRIKLRDIWWFVCTGIMCILLSSTLYFVAIVETGPAVGNILMYTSPIWILIFSVVLFKEKISVFKMLSLALAVLGCAFAVGLIGGKDLKFSTWGIIAGVLSGLFYGLYSIFGKVLLKKYDSVTVILYTTIFAGIGSLFMTNVPEAVTLVVSTKAYIPLLALVLCVTIAPYTLYTVGLKHCKASRASIMAYIEPVTAAFMESFVLGHMLTGFQLLGITLILCAGFILQLKTDK